MKVEVVAHDPRWALDYEREAAAWQDALTSQLVAIYHIGSTSVPGLAAKPIIDMMPVVKDLAKLDACSEPIRALGYEVMGEFGIPGRRYFRKGKDDRTHHVHAFAVGDPNIERHLAFRDYLRAHFEIRAAYGELKKALAAQFPCDIESYMDGKDAWIKETERAALAWQRKVAVNK